MIKVRHRKKVKRYRRIVCRYKDFIVKPERDVAELNALVL